MAKLTAALLLTLFTSTSFAFICCFDGSENLDDLRTCNNIHISMLPGADESDAYQFADQLTSAIRSGLMVKSFSEPLKVLYVPRTGLRDCCFINVSEERDSLSEIYKLNDIVVSPCGGLEFLNFISAD